tara:strand:+ start:21 stop:254 length:234 start_codon:yes stop_codon:yes gene_type:complete
MADTYTVQEAPETPAMVTSDDKDKQISRGYTESKKEVFTIRMLEQGIADCDNQIKNATDRKVELQAKIDEAEKVLAE